MKHKIVMSFSRKRLCNLAVRSNIRRCIAAALEEEGVRQACEINVLVCDDQTIREINAATRNIDKPTDVLSFPMFQFLPGQLPENWETFIDVGTGYVPLGDMAISYARAKKQARQYGHSTAREVGYLTIHSVLHLLGYDHLDEGEMKQQMRAREDAILQKIDLHR